MHIKRDNTFIWLRVLAGATAAAVAWRTLYSKFGHQAKQTKKQLAGDDTHRHVHPDLQKHTNVFEKKVLRVVIDDPTSSSNVYVAVGYSLANCIMIEGTDGIIIIDTTESIESASQVLAEFRKITDKPVEGIIFTHFHHDHVAGAQAFVQDAQERRVEIWAHASTEARMSQFSAIMGPIAYVRATKMYGTKLERPSLENCGIGPFLAGVDDDDNEQHACSIVPTHTYDSPRQWITIAGVELELIHAPGETEDQTVVYMPQHKILFAADNYYESFPNLYTIRGAPHRDVLQWANSLDTMIDTHPDVLVPSHTLPVYGAQEIVTRLVDYRDAIQYVHDQTVRLMLKNYHPDEIATSVELPSNLRHKEYLKEFYGTVGWSAKSIFHGYMGWFSGDECDLYKLTPTEYAYRLLDLAAGSSPDGGENKDNDDGARVVLDKAQEAYNRGDYQWALELTSALLRIAKDDNINSSIIITRSSSLHRTAQALKTDCCARLGEQQISANGRNWYLTSALVACGDVEEIKLPPNLKENAILTMPLQHIFNSLAVRFRPDESLEGVTKSMSFVLLSSGGEDDEVNKEEGWTLQIRNCVLYPRHEIRRDADIVIETTETDLRQLFARPASTIATSLFSNRFKLKKGDFQTFRQFLGNMDLGM